jgi:hypothetical protein
LTISNPDSRSGIFKRFSYWTVRFMRVTIQVFGNREPRPIKWHQCRILTRIFTSFFASVVYAADPRLQAREFLVYWVSWTFLVDLNGVIWRIVKAKCRKSKENEEGKTKTNKNKMIIKLGLRGWQASKQVTYFKKLRSTVIGNCNLCACQCFADHQKRASTACGGKCKHERQAKTDAMRGNNSCTGNGRTYVRKVLSDGKPKTITWKLVVYFIASSSRQLLLPGFYYSAVNQEMREDARPWRRYVQVDHRGKNLVHFLDIHGYTPDTSYWISSANMQLVNELTHSLDHGLQMRRWGKQNCQLGVISWHHRNVDDSRIPKMPLINLKGPLSIDKLKTKKEPWLDCQLPTSLKLPCFYG